ncbi:MAG: biotin transporter BioY [Aerococcus sp.]|nr:biotin transporter BioY [Aerococcus sp.]
MKATKVARLALFLSLMIVGSQLSIPIQPVPITLQTLMVILIGGLLIPSEAGIVMGCYLLLGLIGLPVFAGFSGGMQSILTPSFGFALSFLISAPLISYLLPLAKPWSARRFLGACALHYVLTYSIGLVYMGAYLAHVSGVWPNLTTVLTLGLIPFVIGDVCKYLLAGVVIHRLRQTPLKQWLLR